MCIFVVLSVDETYYFICVNTVMQLRYPNPTHRPPPPPPPLWGAGVTD